MNACCSLPRMISDRLQKPTTAPSSVRRAMKNSRVGSCARATYSAKRSGVSGIEIHGRCMRRLARIAAMKSVSWAGPGRWMTTRARAAIRATLPGAFEHHDGELPPGLRLVVVVLRPDRGHQAPQALALFAIG